MSLKKILFCCLISLFSTSLAAQKGLEKGFYCVFETEGGLVFGGEAGPGAVGSYGLCSALGYRFGDGLTLAGSAVGASTLSFNDNRVTMIPLFIRIRYDILNKRPVSPYLEFDLGYYFMLPNGNCSKEVTLCYDESRREPFSNGSRSFLPVEGNSDWLGLEGEFARLSAGVSWKLGRHRMSAGLCGGVGRRFLGTYVRGADGSSIRFARIDYLEETTGLAESGGVAAGVDGAGGYRRGAPVLTAGRSRHVAPTLTLRLSFSL